MRRSLASALVGCALSGCGGAATERELRFVDLASPGLVAPVELTDETRKALTLDLASRIELDLRLPDDPILHFAIGASSRDRPTLLAPVVFRVLVDETEVFREVLRRSQGRIWFPRTAELTSWSGRSARVVLEATRGEGGPKGASAHVLAHWGHPVIRSRSQAPSGTNLILISIDCLRADHVGAYGYRRPTTPNLDAFARESTLFRDAMAVSSYTLPTHASMLTGLPPSFHGATQRRRISRSVESLPELLSSAGYGVQGVVSAPFLAPVYGFADGFDTYKLSSARAAGLVDKALELLDEGAGFPRFLFLHLFDAHHPYSPPGEYIERFGGRTADISKLHAKIQKGIVPASDAIVEQARSLYDGEIAYVDHELGRFFEELRKRGLYDSSLVVVTADHGEAFLEHGHWEHGRPWRGNGPGLYQELLHVPLLVKRPGQREGEVVEGLVSQTDIFATFLEAAGSARKGPWSLSLLRNRGKDYALSEFLATPQGGGAILQVAIRRGALKYWAFYRADALAEILDGAPSEEALYDLATDPGESRSLLADGEGRGDALRETLKDYLEAARARRAASEAEEVNLDPELRRKLESLGYIEH